MEDNIVGVADAQHIGAASLVAGSYKLSALVTDSMKRE
jgi:hypothetical protein